MHEAWCKIKEKKQQQSRKCENSLKFQREGKQHRRSCMYLNIASQKVTRLTARLRLNLSHFRDIIFKHNFQNCLNPISSCSLDIEATSHVLLHCLIFNDERYTILNTLNKTDCKVLDLTNSSLSQNLLYCNIFDKEKKTHSKRNYWIYFIHWKIRRTYYLVNFHCKHQILPKLFLNNLLFLLSISLSLSHRLLYFITFNIIILCFIIIIKLLFTNS